MKLSKLYCNKDFHNISFNTAQGGVNAIIGDAKGKKQHNLGKSKLAELIDFMLLRTATKDFFLYKEPSRFKGEGYEFYLEVLLNNGQYLIIKRSVDFPTKIAFKLAENSTPGFVLFQDFDEQPSSFDKAKARLNELLDFDFCKATGESYRRLVNYSLRTQGDYDPKMNTIFQLRKFAKNKDKDWKPLLFNLLGFDGEALRHKYELEEKIKTEQDAIKAQERDFGIKPEDKDLLVGKIQNAEADKESIAKDLHALDFYQQDKETIGELVGHIEAEIAALNTQAYNLAHDINKLQESIRNHFDFDLEKVQRIFSEVQLHFPGQLAKKYEDLVEFNRQITQERNLEIRKILKEKEAAYREVNTRLADLNQQRKQFSELIQDTSLFRRYTAYQSKLVEAEKDIARYRGQLDAIDLIERKKKAIEATRENDLKAAKETLKTILDRTADNERYSKIRRTFSEIVRRILQEDALVVIKLNTNYNVEFVPEFPNSAKADGYTYYKILCIAFDLAILINYRDQSHFRFVYHDDVISGDDNGVKSRLIQVVSEIATRYDLQYVFTAIRDNLPPSPDISEQIVLELNDASDSGRLFKMVF
jgi:uncharacterized protein YydD (DUF2326 family)